MDQKRADGRWIYGVVPAGARLRELEAGAAQNPQAWIVESEDLAAIVGPIPRADPRGTRDQALAHSRVLEAAVADAPVVPFRFGMMAQGGDEEVRRQLLDGYHDQLVPLLQRLKGVVQMTLQVVYREDVLLREILGSEPEIAHLNELTREGPEVATRDDRVRLGELLGAAVEMRRQRDAAEILQGLQHAATATVANELEQEYMVLNQAFLVERQRQAEFDQAVEALAEKRSQRMRFRTLGPMPAYNFVNVAGT